MNTDTPRMTEAWARSSRTADGFYSSTTPMSVHARSCYEEGCKLERELTAVTEQRDEWKAKYIQQNKDLGCEMMDPNGTIWDHAKKVQLELTAITEQRNRLAEALRVATAYPLTESWYKQAIEALATLKP